MRIVLILCGLAVLCAAGLVFAIALHVYVPHPWLYETERAILLALLLLVTSGALTVVLGTASGRYGLTALGVAATLFSGYAVLKGDYSGGQPVLVFVAGAIAACGLALLFTRPSPGEPQATCNQWK